MHILYILMCIVTSENLKAVSVINLLSYHYISSKVKILYSYPKDKEV